MHSEYQARLTSPKKHASETKPETPKTSPQKQHRSEEIYSDRFVTLIPLLRSFITHAS
jgi:hypothetical protein